MNPSRPVSRALVLGVLALALLPAPAWAQITCTGIGPSLICTGDSGMSVQTPLGSPNRGVIVGPGTAVTPYAILPSPPPTRGGVQPLTPLPDTSRMLTPPPPPPETSAPSVPYFVPGFGYTYGSGQ